MANEFEARKIAIVGFSCALPSGHYAKEDLSYNMLWDFLMTKSESYEEIPQDRFDINQWFGKNAGQISTRKGNFLKNPTQFDHIEFGISLKDATALSPSSRKLIELAFLALQDAGIDYRGKRMGCFMSGINSGLVDRDPFDEQGSFANAPAMPANRVSYTLDINGPSVALDTACSSSMTGTHLAIQSLLGGDCDTALVGSCQYDHWLQDWVGYSVGGVLAPDGKCKPFDAGGDGFSRSEGAGVFVLKPLDKALADGDKIYATIIGSAINSTGGGSAPNQPVGSAQQEAIKLAYQRAGKDPRTVDFVELHATGTAVGDPIEANAVGELFNRQEELIVGSIKGNMGHLENTAFIASLAKVCLIFEHGIMPPQANLKSLNPAIHWKKYNLRVPFESIPLDVNLGSRPILTSISSFGIGGANGHAILESFVSAAGDYTPTVKNGPYLIIGGGLTPKSAGTVASDLAAMLEEHPEQAAEISRISIRRARQLLWRTAAVYESGKPISFPEPTSVPRVVPPIVYVMSGQGPQHFDMGRQLYAENPVFRASIDEMDDIYRNYAGVSLIESTGLFRTLEKPALKLPAIWSIALILPSIAMFQMAMVDMLTSVGVHPTAVVGHSAGETALMYASGASPKKLALEVSIARGRAMALLEAHKGTMAAMACNRQQAEALMSTPELGKDIIDIACHNAPDAVALSGPADIIDNIMKAAAEKNIWARRLQTNCPVHGTMMDICKTEYQKSVGHVFRNNPPVTEPTIQTFSTLSGGILDQSLSAEYFWKNARNTVLFTEAMTAIRMSHPNAIYVELAPHPVLSSYITAIVGQPAPVTCPAKRARKGETTKEMATFLTSVGELCLKGYNSVDVKTVPRIQANGLILPAYPFAQRTVPWHSESDLGRSRFRVRNGPLNYPGIHVNTGTHPDLADHIIQGEPIMPATGYLEIAFESGARQLWDVGFYAALSLSSARPAPIEVSVDGHSWTIRSRGPRSKVFDRVNAGGYLSKDSAVRPNANLEAIKARCKAVSAKTFLDSLTFANFGPGFRRIEELYNGNGEAVAIVRGWDDKYALAAGYQFNPAILDSCLQAAYTLVPGRDTSDMYFLPARCGYIALNDMSTIERPSSVVAHIRLAAWTPEAITFDYHVYTPEGQWLCSMESFTMDGHRGIPKKPVDNRLESVWQPIRIPAIVPAPEKVSSTASAVSDLLTALDAAAVKAMSSVVASNPVAPDDVSRQRYLAFMQKAAESGRPTTSMEVEEQLKEKFGAPFEILQRVAQAQEKLLTTVDDAVVDGLFKDNILMELYKPDGIMGAVSASLAEQFRKTVAHVVNSGKRVLKVLELATGSGSLTAALEPIIHEFPGIVIEYVASDAAPAVLGATLNRLGYHKMRSQTFDMSKEPESQGLVLNSFDIVTGLNVLHTVPDISVALVGLNSLLVPGGSLLIADIDGAQWGSIPGALWCDFVFGVYKSWFSYTDARSHAAPSANEWSTQLETAGFNVVARLRDADGPFVMLAGQKDVDISPVAAPAIGEVLQYRLGHEGQIQHVFKKYSPEDSPTFWIAAPEGLDGDGVLGFARSLQKEFPTWTIKLAVFSGERTEAEQKRLLSAWSSRLQHEWEVHFDLHGEASVMRIAPAVPCPTPGMVAFDPAKPWAIQDGTVVQTSLPYVGKDDVLVQVEVWHSLGTALKAFVGRVGVVPSGGFQENELVAGITAQNEASCVTALCTSLARVENKKLTSQELVSIVGLAAVASVINADHKASQRTKTPRRALILNDPTTESLGAILKRLNWDVSTQEQLFNAGIRRTALPVFDVIIGTTETVSALRESPKSLPYPSFCWDDASDGLLVRSRQMAFGEDLEAVLGVVDKQSLTPHVSESATLLPPPGALVKNASSLLSPTKTYLLVGGIGGLGIRTAAWMYEQGARYIVLTSRSGEASLARLNEPVINNVVDYLKSLPDLTLRLEACDANSSSAVKKLCNTFAYPLGGALIMAVVLQDRVFMDQTAETFRSVYESKVGAYKTLADVYDLSTADWLVMFSSVAGLFGNGGQTNYASANTVLDAIVGKLPNAFTLIVPPILDVGVFARAAQENAAAFAHLKDWGMTCEDLCDYIGDGIKRLQETGPFTFQVPDLNWLAVEKTMGISSAFHHLAYPPRSDFADGGAGGEEKTIDDVVCEILQVPKDDLSQEVPLTRYGLDSLSAARLAAGLRPFGTISQLQLLSDLTVFDIKAKLGDGAAPAGGAGSDGRGASPIVKIKDDGSVPIIMTHGADGSIAPMKMLSENFKGSVWAIQLTGDAPMESLEVLADWYYDHIKAARPQGPYRLCAFSASGAVMVYLCKKFEAAGDQVLQLGFVDHFPLATMGGGFDLRIAVDKDGMLLPEYMKIIISRMGPMMVRDSKIDPVRRTLGEDLNKWVKGEETSELATSFIDIVRNYASLETRWIIKKITGGVTSAPWDPKVYVRWLQDIKAPTTMIWGLDGYRNDLPKEWRNPGHVFDAHSVYPDAKLIEVPGGHAECLASKEAADILAEGFSVGATA
ncbi:polyketide synthase [Dacryopinax primogenitus]|uniref:Polyketide synthase n=1 Tax=Dacryopinax primogenitus (strain DJM 731) TaxID=1858805 RepID=M5G836_DACPD|nr:polyketide synthase [Dacryopinax primogenitus]EJU06376.1 polyketide synthase [Dacryopinax primogenitus]